MVVGLSSTGPAAEKVAGFIAQPMLESSMNPIWANFQFRMNWM